MKCSNVSTKTDLFSVQLISSLSEILLFCNGERALTSIKSTCLKAGTHQTDTRRTAGTGRLEGPNPDGLILCELALNTLIIIRVKRRSSLSWLTWPEARPRMTPKHSRTTVPFSLRVMCAQTYKHTYTHMFWHSMELESKCWN